MTDEHPDDDDATFPDDADVFRGSDMAVSKWLERNARGIHEELLEEWGREVWALSVGCEPDMDIQEIARHSEYDGDLMMTSTVGRLRAAGFNVIPDRDPEREGDVHALLILREEPSEPLWDRLRTCFDGPFTIERGGG